MKKNLIVVFAFIFFFAPLRAQVEVKKGGDFNILLITLDTTRADHLGCYGYLRAKTPNMDGLAQNGVKFNNAYAQVPLTLPSHCSMMTGTYPLYHQVHGNGYYYLGREDVTLAEILKKKGFKTAAFVSSFTVDSRFGIDQGFDLYDDKFLEEEALKNFRSERRADKVFAAFSPWLERNFDQKFFCWVHFYDPHLPYDPPSSYKPEFYDHPYDGEIAFVDFTVGQIIAQLKAKKILDKTFILIAGDHGEALGEKREIDHGLFIYENTLRVPLIFYFENRLPQGLVIYPRVRLIDLLPTVLDSLNIPAPEVQGTSLLPYIAGQKRESLPSYIETFFPTDNFGWASLQGLTDGQWKYIQAPKPELYNLRSDPLEENNLFQKEKAIAGEEAGKLADMIKTYSKQGPGKKRTLTAEEEEKLRSLGYVSGGLQAESSKKDLPDPKDKIEDYILYYQGNILETEGKFEEASKSYQELLRRNPDVPSVYAILGFLYMKMNKTEESIRLLEQARAKFPSSVFVLSRLAGAYLKAERLADVVATGEAILKVDPRNFDALFLLGSVTGRMEKGQEALAYFQKAMEIEPENKAVQQRFAYVLATLGRFEEALKIYTRLKEKYPDDYTLDFDLGRLYDSKGDKKQAREYFKMSMEKHPSPDTTYNYALFLGKVGELKEAVVWLKRYLETTQEVNTPRKNKAQEMLAQWEKRLK